MNLGRPNWHHLYRFALQLLACTIASPSVSRAQTTFPTGWESTTSTSLRAAGRILNQATFGPTVNDIYNVEAIGIPAYVAQQLNEPAYQMESVIPQVSYGSGDCNGWSCDPEAYWWQDVLFGQDQLRQRVAFALSKLFVVSYNEVDPRYYPYYLNKLSVDAFGNWYQLMQDVTLSGAMGTYLNMANSLATAGSHADENYARELMQLFSIGTVVLNQDGSPKLVNGSTVPNYTPAVVQSFAQAYTGYTFANNDCSTPSAPNSYWWPDPPGQSCPMVPLAQYHNTSQKTLLRGQVLPAGQTAAEDVNAALTNIFNDPSLPPFVSMRLIQNLVKSNPSPAYISRIAGVFINDGKGVRGDMKAVISAILLDPEARADDTPGTSNPLSSTPTTAGIMRDPVLWWTSMLRGVGATQNMVWPWDGVYNNTFDTWLGNLNESPHQEPSVFSFYAPTNTLPGTNLYAPEFELENPYSLSWMIDHAQDLLDDKFYLSNANEFTLNITSTSGLGQVASAEGPTGLVDALSALFMHGTMTTDMRDSIVQAVQGLDTNTMVENAIFLVVTSPQYRIMI